MMPARHSSFGPSRLRRRYAKSVAMAAELKRVGVDHEFISVPGGEHGFDSKGMRDAEVSAAFERIEMFLRKHVGEPDG